MRTPQGHPASSTLRQNALSSCPKKCCLCFTIAFCKIETISLELAAGPGGDFAVAVKFGEMLQAENCITSAPRDGAVELSIAARSHKDKMHYVVLPSKEFQIHSSCCSSAWLPPCCRGRGWGLVLPCCTLGWVGLEPCWWCWVTEHHRSLRSQSYDYLCWLLYPVQTQQPRCSLQHFRYFCFVFFQFL